MTVREVDPAFERLRIVGSRKRAERLRLEAVELAREYAKLARRQRLDPEVVRADVAGVVAAWDEVPRSR
jgi:hypothetical protein